MRISDWSSDVCSSDLPHPRVAFARPRKGTTVVMGDGHRLERAIDNVIDNAISFSPANGLVCVSARRLGDEVYVKVDDIGPGIEPKSEDSRVGNEIVIQSRYLWTAFYYIIKLKNNSPIKSFINIHLT